MFGTHNTFLKKIFSRKVETNSLEPLNIEVSKTIVPTLSLEPSVNIVKVISSTGGIYTTPTDKDFYLTGYVLQGINNSSTNTLGTATIQYQLENGDTISHTASSELDGLGSPTVIKVDFPKGCLLSKNITIAVTIANAGNVLIHGFTGSDRG